MDTGLEERTFVTLQNGKPITLRQYRLLLHPAEAVPPAPPPLTPADWRKLAMARIKAENISYKFLEAGRYAASDAIDEIRNGTELGEYFVAVQKRAVEITFALANAP